MARIRPPRLREADLEVTPTTPSDRPLASIARLMQKGWLGEAVRICLAVVKQLPGNTALWSFLSNAHAAQHQYANSFRSYGRVLAAAPDSANVLNNFGAVHQLRSESKRAAGCFRRAFALKPDYAKAHYNLGNALKEASERGASICAYEQAIAHNPGDAEAHNNFGTVFEDQGHTTRTLGELSRAMAMDETYVEAHYNYALLQRFQAVDPTLDNLQQLDSEQGQSRRNKNRLAFAPRSLVTGE